ncbi:hypothetical protein FN976_07590 [Caenimonas sedimenti]|uniref:DUF2486 family protein n=1 Tax=Caenimonas sedimenti TaxID=2596921 RepID=A0A562ZTW5_9BURK|nr:hypothetical protein [Caenimonas sedimenti]TWO71847.1 hypothetical protein FN976_07590 [Caenimonas sedimenti]
MATRAPPRFVPTLTEVVQGGAPPAQAAVAARDAAADAGPQLSQEQLAQRVLQRLDLTLDRRVREAISTVILEQTSALGPLLRERLEAVVRQAVAQAVAEELKARQRPGARGV